MKYGCCEDEREKDCSGDGSHAAAGIGGCSGSVGAFILILTGEIYFCLNEVLSGSRKIVLVAQKDIRKIRCQWRSYRWALYPRSTK
jgi:hypothetical protein